MNSDSTRAPSSPADFRALDPLTDRSDFHRLLTNLGSLGEPPAPEAPPFPEADISWNARYQIIRRLGQGAQGVVYLVRREGVDGYFTNVALKVFHRSSSWSAERYIEEMQRVARQAQRVSRLQHDGLLSIRDFVAIQGTRVMVMEWIDGFDLGRLLEKERLEKLRRRLPKKLWEHLADVIATPGEDHCRLKPGIAVDILRGCLSGLSPLHHNGIVHCDLKPSNIMVKNTGTKKIIDIDSSCVPDGDAPRLRGTPYYMAPEVLKGKPVEVRSDIASLGYVLIEMLTGRKIFRDSGSVASLLDAKLKLPSRLDQILPAEVCKNAILRGLVGKMVAVEPKDRFPDADAAELDRLGAVSFHNQLVKNDLSTEYSRELAWWLELLNEGPEVAPAP